jgi:peroxiredoxin
VVSWLSLDPGGLPQRAGPPQVGHSAPDFALPDQTGSTVCLRAFRDNQSVLLVFYIKAFTPT